LHKPARIQCVILIIKGKSTPEHRGVSLSAALGQAKRKKLRRGERDKRAESVQNRAKGDRGNATEMRIYVYENIFTPAAIRPELMNMHANCGEEPRNRMRKWVARSRAPGRAADREAWWVVTLRCIFISRLCTGSC